MTASSEQRGFEFSAPAGTPSSAAGPRLITVGQLNALIKRVLGDNLPGTIHLVGQISNLTRHTSGHLYLTLKDEQGEIRSVMWKSAAASVKFAPADGLEVVATGYVDVYEPRGQYQFYISRLEPRGVGALELAFRQLHERLGREGLFDAARKRSIPRFPRTIAVITSPTGAAIRDILQTIRRRYRCAAVLIHPVRVQGDGAAAEIAAAVERLNRHAAALGGIDVIIVGRGGGSLEDLWAFNEELVARALSASEIPIISGVGHEVDVTIADLVADLRAPTPTAAAELATPVLDEVLDGLAGSEGRLRRAVRRGLEHLRVELAAIERMEWFRDLRSPLRRAEQQLDEWLSRLRHACGQRIAGGRTSLHQAALKMMTRQPGVRAQHDRDRLELARQRLNWVVRSAVRLAAHALDRSQGGLTALQPALRLAVENRLLARERQRLGSAVGHRLILEHRALEAFGTQLVATGYQRTLARGFTITRIKRGRAIVSHAGQVREGDVIITETADGQFESRVRDRAQLDLFE